MKYLKKWKLFESVNELEIHSLCEEYDIENYTINSDGTIDVDGGVDLGHKGLTKLPLKFNKVSGHFFCDDNQLTNLKGAPSSVGGIFDCSDNQLTTLKDAPKSVVAEFYCYNNKLISLKGLEFKSFKFIILVGNSIYTIVKEWINNDNHEELIEYFLDMDIIQEGEYKPKLIMMRLEAFYEDMGLEMNIDFDEVKKYYEIIK
jgi:hypothetical protein